MSGSVRRKIRLVSTSALGMAAAAAVSWVLIERGNSGFDRPVLDPAPTAGTGLGLLPKSATAPICHSAASIAAAGATIRLAQSHTEVPPTEMKAATAAPDFADSDPPLWDGLGPVGYKITTSSAQAQAYFDQGLRLAYAFNHGEAQRAFRKAQKLDPACAM